jgi:hypothetical protein
VTIAVQKSSVRADANAERFMTTSRGERVAVQRLAAGWGTWG